MTSNEATGINTTIGEGFLPGINTGIYFNGVDAYSDFGSTVYIINIERFCPYLISTFIRILEESFQFLFGLKLMELILGVGLWILGMGLEWILYL